MEWLLMLGGSLALVLLFVWGSRRIYNRLPHRFDFEGEMHNRHPDGHFTDQVGVRIAEPTRVARLEEEWAIVSDGHRSLQRDRQRQLDGTYSGPTHKPSKLEKVLDFLGSF